MNFYAFANRLSIGKMLYMLMIFVMTIIMLWFRMNYPPYQQLADMYLILFLIGIVAWTFDYVTSIGANKNQKNPPPYTQIVNTCFYNDNTIIGPVPVVFKIGTFIFSIVFCMIVAIQIGAMNQSIIQVPAFQIVDLGVVGKTIVTIAMTIGEDIVFFGFIAPTISGLGRLISGGIQLVGTVSSLAITPVIFMLFHFLVYGATDMTGSAFTFVFALICTSWVLVIRNLILPNFLHITNNVTLEIAGAIGIA